MTRRDPKLFLKKQSGKFDAYSRLCPFIWHRHPVSLTKKEKEKIDKEHPGSYTHALKYGSSTDKEHWYICPRYWCLKDNVSLTEKEVKEGKCGGKVIPYGAKNVPKDTFIFEFNSGNKNNTHKDKEGNYINHSPGFLKTDTHPDGLCIPCCFKSKSWSSKSQEKRKEYCKDTTVKIKTEKPLKIVKQYIKEPTKHFPLKQYSLGYLPFSVQKLLNENNENCQESKKNKALKKNYVCLLREGIKNNKKQSFIACLADVYSRLRIEDKMNTSKIYSIIKMKDTIKKKCILDIFITLQNGTLVETFYNIDKEVDTSNYENSEIYKKLNKQNFNSNKQKYFEKICNAHINFIDYLNNDEVEINYEYLWDFVSLHLLNEKINLLIFNLPDDDITNNIEIICPTNHYSTTFYNKTKNTLIILKKDQYYEPVYAFEHKNIKDTNDKNIKDTNDDDILIVKILFSRKDKPIRHGLKTALTDIKDYLLKCTPKESMPDVYKFKINLNATDIVKKLTSNYKYTNQILNYNNKIIGISIENTTTHTKDIFIPCKPTITTPLLNLPETTLLTLDDVKWNDYTTTRDELTTLSKLNIPCKPIMKVLEDELIVGILTETNQFVLIDPPTENIYDDELEEERISNVLKPIQGKNQVKVDVNTLENVKPDEKRIEIVKNISNEQKFFNTFRSTIRILINNYNNFTIRNEIKQIVYTNDLYINKLKILISKLKELTNGYVKFNNYSNINSINNITTCFDKQKCENFKHCRTEKNKCVLIIPKNHLISNYDNEKIYYGRIADELLRYKNINKYMFTTNKYLNFNTINYNLHKNEIILLESLFKHYYDDIILEIKNKYIQNKPYDIALPNITKAYDNTINLNQKIKTTKKSLTIIKISNLAPNDNWRDSMPKKTQKYDIETGYIIINIITNFTDKKLTIIEAKNQLCKIYEKIIKENGIDSIINILHKQGKVNLMKKIKSDEISINDLIMSEHYYFTNLDICLLANKYKIPLIIVSATKLQENEKRLITYNYDINNPFYYVIKQLGININIVQKYRSFLTPDEKLRFEYSSFPQKTQKEIKTNKVSSCF